METKKTDVKTPVWIIAGFGVALWLAGWLFFGKEMPQQVPLWYSRPWGELQLAKPTYLGLFPILTTGVAFLTTWILGKSRDNAAWQQIYGWSGIIAELVLTIAFLRIWTLVI